MKGFLLALGTAVLASAAGVIAIGSELFEARVRPIFERRCLACHGAGQRSGLDLRTEASALRGGSRGPTVVAGKPAESLIYRLLTRQEEPAMPMGGEPIPEAELDEITRWIAALPPEAVPHSSAAAGPPLRHAGTAVTDRDREFWSFRPVTRPAVPEVERLARVRNPIDAFVLARLEAKGLELAPPADPAVLIRRVYFDLVGLPPPHEEVTVFANNPSEKEYRDLIDRLLASPHYGERWGRHWLDLARYADSGGFEFDYDRPHAWRYRDWVIRAFNDDMPYDRFILQQLAGDELAPDRPEALIPTGFCRNGPTVDNQTNEQTRMDELDDIVSTTSSVFLGLTAGCARCHDHKYDPLPQRDYYRLQAVFFPFQKTERLLVEPAEEAAFKARNKEIEGRVRPLRERIAELERPHRERLLAEKVEFHTRLAERAGALEGKTREEYSRGLAERFARDVKLQPEEIEAKLSPEERATRKEIQAEVNQINRERPKLLPTAMGITDRKNPGTAHVLLRGDFRQKGEVVQPGVPEVLLREPILEATDRRRRLADWIASPENPLTARVAANRIWQHHFGRGIVRTASDFGANGERPSHPELLDWLASELVEKGWSWKAMHRLILTSATYRQSSRYDARAAEADPENRLLWRVAPRRLEAEIVRDSILSVSGSLNREMGGPGFYPRIDPSVISTGSTHKWPTNVREGPAEWRRSVYIFAKRSVAVPLLEVFDCPETTVSTPVRSVSTVSPQALALLNNEFVLEQARHFAERLQREVGSERSAQVRRAFRLALARAPRAPESKAALAFLAWQARGHAERGETAPERAALRDFCHALFNLNEFLYVD